RWTIKRQRPNKEKVRFTDKSQIYTLKASNINELLKENNPHFILIVRNPYAMCFRAAQAKGALGGELKNKLNFEERLKLATEHWSNLMKYTLEDKEKVKNFQIIKFEDVLKDTKNTIQKICNFTDLEFQKDMIPQKNHKIPFGTKHRDRWYPLKENINQKYLKQLTSKQTEIIERRCGKYAERFGYKKP
ncbi:MAG: sulfotransferase, partial [Minisyncoccales bacterium]